MHTELSGVVLMYLLALLAALPLGKYIGKLMLREATWPDRFFDPIDRVFYRLSGIDPARTMSWKQHLAALLTINLAWFLLGMLILMNMGWLPLNPDALPSMGPELAFNTTVSFICNTNLQHYSGETAMSYLGQLILMLFQFVSAGCSMAIAAVVFLAMREKGGADYGNFYVLFIRCCTRVLFPLSLLMALILLFNGTPMTFAGRDTMISLQGDTVQVSRGPVAAFVPIKHLGTNGGGFFGPNSAHPFENPNYLTNMAEQVAQMILPLAMIFALGYVLRHRRLAWMILAVMSLGFLVLLLPALWSELQGNPALRAMGLTQYLGSMEGKELRFGAAASAYWSIATTVISTGSINAMHDSFMPLSAMSQLLGMMVNCFYGGVGVGFLNCYLFIILAVFISGLMVGRTPEFLGKKIGIREMKIAMIIALLHPLLILSGTAIASHVYATDPQACTGWLNNPGFHGFTEMLYEFTSSAANNGSGFEGLGDNTTFWNIACGIVMLLARYLPIVGPVAIAGSLATKKYIPEAAGTLKTDTPTFALLLFALIMIVAALSFFPALALGPLAEFFSLYH